MAEQVNQRIEDMINELEQMRRINLYDEEEIKEISRKRKEFEYKIQRRVKQKEDYVDYIAYELALMEDMSLRRKQRALKEKKTDIEYAIAKRMMKLFKQFIYRFQNDIEIYFEYIRFCQSVGFEYAVSGIIGQMLQIHGDKPKMWQMASRWESKEQNNFNLARDFLLKGIHRHPDSEILYIELFELETRFVSLAEDIEEKEKLIKRTNVVWRNGLKNINNVSYLLKLCDISIKSDVESITADIKQEIWSKRNKKDVWCYIASKELEGCHWEQIEEFTNEESRYCKKLKYFIATYEEALQQFADKTLSTKYIHGLLGLNENICDDLEKISAVKHAWMYCHKHGLLSDEMYDFGFKLLKLDNETSNEKLIEILDTATKLNPEVRCIWEEKILLNKTNENEVLSILKQASKVLKPDDTIYLWNIMLDNVNSKTTLLNLYKRFQNCESTVLLAIKPKLLQKTYEQLGLSTAREMYNELIKIPPMQLDVHKVMIDIEVSQEKLNLKQIRKCYECAIQNFGTNNLELWVDFMKFESENDNAQSTPLIYRRAIAMLNKDLVDKFIKVQSLERIK